MSSKVKLVADRCWELDKIRVADVKNTSDLTNALKIIHYNDEYLFRCERPEDKMSLLVTVKRVTDELLESSKQNDADAKLSVNGKHTVHMQRYQTEFTLIIHVSSQNHCYKWFVSRKFCKAYIRLDTDLFLL